MVFHLTLESAMHDDSTKTTPIGLTRYAHDFFDSARAVEGQLGKATSFELVSPVPSLYLIGHSSELALKAYLLQHGLTLRELRYKQYGHDLHACQRKAKELGEQPTRLPILRGESPLSVNCPDLDG